MTSICPGLFFTGTDTDVGKTYVASLVARTLVAQGHCVGVYKPAASGCRERGGELVSDDALALWEAAGRPGELDRVCPQRFRAPLAPHLAAQDEGRLLDETLLATGLEYWTARSDIVLVEGAGGLLSPMGEQLYVADLALQLAFPLVIVAPDAIGVINQVLQTLLAAQGYRGGLPVAGVVLNRPPLRPSDPSRQSNSEELRRRASAPLLTSVVAGGQRFEMPVDWFQLASAGASD